MIILVLIPAFYIHYVNLHASLIEFLYITKPKIIMSLGFKVFCNNLSDDLIPEIKKRLNEFEMDVDIHPNFSFATQTRFLPFKFQLTNFT